MTKLIIGVLASTKGTDLQAVIGAIEQKELDAEIACVISNKEDSFALKRARKHGIEVIFLNPKDFDSMEKYDGAIAKLFNKRNVGLVLLIGYNKILSKAFVDAFKNRVMNIHPSLLPFFKGWYASIYPRVLEANVKETGCTLFFVDQKPDAGPIILQKIVSVDENETIDSLKKKVQKAEQEVLLKGVKLFLEGRLKVEGKRVYVAKA